MRAFLTASQAVLGTVFFVACGIGFDVNQWWGTAFLFAAGSICWLSAHRIASRSE